jgi:hypothetical protein
LPRLRFGASSSAMRAVLALAAALSLVACSREPPSAPRLRAPQPPPPMIDAGNWARRVGSVEGAPAAAPQPPELRAAVMHDDVEDSDEFVTAGRLVYRLGFYVPASFRDLRAAIKAPAGELQIDVSADRLRARFVGPGWPVPDGSEVRLRSDLPGVYVFDGRGGRSLGAGELAAWFEGREGKKVQTVVGVLRAYGLPVQRPFPAGLLCALFAEWAHQERESLVHRCADGALPPGFHVGPWSGELTAVVQMRLPRRALRADEVDPPATLGQRSGGTLIEPTALSRLSASRAQSGSAPASLLVDNGTDTRAIVIAQGVPVGWVDAGQSLRIDGFNPGMYRVGAIRPLGILRMAPKLVRIPGQLVIGRARAATPAVPKSPPDAATHDTELR